jgi:hypothetical protein
MIAVWIVLGLAIVAGLARRAARLRADSDLGFVSRQWLAEYRLSHISNPQR